MKSFSSEISVRPLTLADLPRIASLHLPAFPESALSRLGHEAVRRYYHWLLTGPHDAVAVGAWEGGKLLGFCFGGLYRGATSGFLARNRTYLLRRVLMRPWLAFSPLFRERLGVAFQLLMRRLPLKGVRRTEPERATERQVHTHFGILAIATHPRHQGKGVGRLLMQTCEEQARQRGVSAMNLTVHPDNVQAVRFYEKQGWTRVEEQGTWRGAMRKSLVD